MNLKTYIKDKWIYVVSLATTGLLGIAILCALNPVGGSALSYLIGGLYLLGGFSPLAYEYVKKKVFYDHLLAIFDSLDRKNLIAEMVQSPDFREGMILYDLLSRSNKAMLEEINTYRFRQEEYREYLEMWVHEIKTPISSSRLIAQNNESEAMRSIGEELARIEAFVEQVLFYSRSNHVEKDYLIREINLQSLCYEILRKESRLFIQNHIRVETVNLDQKVYSDNKWLEFILTQILTNSIKYRNPQEAWIRLSAERLDNAVRLHVADNGVGIIDQELPRIFDKGFTGTNGRKNERATGMGLYICKKLCDKLGIGLEAQSTWGSGTLLTLILPVGSMTDIL